MDKFETPYEEEAAFLECTVCDKSIRGDTLYKIHLTTPGHIKKEDALVASGLAVRRHNIPIFEDILQYLDYMKLDEPIIGLTYLEELPNNDPLLGPKYNCKLCHQKANLPEMVHHVIGRKHRQKYVELKRPDLVTWNKQSIITHGGKIIRARAEIIERQDGRGTPGSVFQLTARKGIEGKLNISRGQKQNRGQYLSHSLTQRDVPSHLPDLMGIHTGRYPTPPFHPEDPYVSNRDRPRYQQEDTLCRDVVEEELQSADYRESGMHRRECMDSHYRKDTYEEEYFDEPQGSSGDNPRYDSRDEMPHGQAKHVEYYPEEAPYRKPYPEKDQLKEFYSKEVRRRSQVCSGEYQPSQPVYPKRNEQRWSMDRESGRHDVNRADRQGSSESEGQRRSVPTSMESDQSRESHLFNIVRDYYNEMRGPHQEEPVTNSGPNRTGPPTSQRRVETTMSDIPEPFRLFLKGSANEEVHGKRKRKSRFSDATAEEVETTKEMFSDEYGPPRPKFGGRPPSVSVQLRPENHGTQHPDFYVESQSVYRTDGNQREDSESRDVFDMLKNVEIENAEEADFLKNKLCNLLKEFKTKKSEKAVQNSYSRAAIPKDYNGLNSELSPRHQYVNTRREDSDLRRPEDLKEDYRGAGWRQREHIPDEQLQEYQHPGEPRQSSRSRYEEVFGRSRMSRTQPAAHPDEPAHYSERFQEPMHPRNYPTASEEFMDSHSSAPPLHMERGLRMDRDSWRSSNLDKITSTLLELVARK